jgi:hypothetical protein
MPSLRFFQRQGNRPQQLHVEVVVQFPLQSTVPTSCKPQAHVRLMQVVPTFAGVDTLQLPSQVTVPPQLPQPLPKFAGVGTLQLPLQVTVPPQLPQARPKLGGVGSLQAPVQVTEPPQLPQADW